MRNGLLCAALLTLTLFACGAGPEPEPPLAALPDCEWCGVTEAPKELSWSTTIAGPDEPGERLEITGTVTRNGQPLPNVILYAYHTNREGIYPKRGNETGNGRRHGYLRGWVRTDAKGRYRIDTIRPASYPNSRALQHIHMSVGEPGKPEQLVDEIHFADDPFHVTSSRTAPGVVTVKREGGVWRGVRDIELSH